MIVGAFEVAPVEPVDPVEPVAPVDPVEPVAPPVVIEPLPVRLNWTDCEDCPGAPDAVTEGKEPVAPLYVPVPPVIVIEPEPDVVCPESADTITVTGADMFPVIVFPEEIVIVKGMLAVSPVSEVSDKDELKVPVPRLPRFAVPVEVNVVLDSEPVAFTVIVTLVVAA